MFMCVCITHTFRRNFLNFYYTIFNFLLYYICIILKYINYIKIHSDKMAALFQSPLQVLKVCNGNLQPPCIFKFIILLLDYITQLNERKCSSRWNHIWKHSDICVQTFLYFRLELVGKKENSRRFRGQYTLCSKINKFSKKKKFIQTLYANK